MILLNCLFKSVVKILEKIKEIYLWWSWNKDHGIGETTTAEKVVTELLKDRETSMYEFEFLKQ